MYMYERWRATKFILAVGEKKDLTIKKKLANPGPVKLEVVNLQFKNKLKDINFQLLLNQSIGKYVQKMLEHAFIYDKQLVGIHTKLDCCQVSL